MTEQDPFDEATIAAGLMLGNYRLQAPLNKGGMGQLWHGHEIDPRDPDNPYPVAVKMPRVKTVFDAQVREGLLAEADILRKLDHGNVPKVLATGQYGNMPYFVMEFIRGGTALELLRFLSIEGTPLKIATAVHIVRAVGGVAAYGHDFKWAGRPHPIIHRDISLANVMINAQGHVYLIDYGVAARASYSTQTIKGTWHCMAPEQLWGKVTPMVDVYALGALLHSLVDGRPFRGHLAEEDLRPAVAAGFYEPWVRPHVPDVVRYVCDGWLMPDPRKRLTIQAGLAALRAAKFPDCSDDLEGLAREAFKKSVDRSGASRAHPVYDDELMQVLQAAQLKSVRPSHLHGSGALSAGWSKSPAEDTLPGRVHRGRTRANLESAEVENADIPIPRTDAITLRRKPSAPVIEDDEAPVFFGGTQQLPVVPEEDAVWSRRQVHTERRVEPLAPLFVTPPSLPVAVPTTDVLDIEVMLARRPAWDPVCPPPPVVAEPRPEVFEAPSLPPSSTRRATSRPLKLAMWSILPLIGILGVWAATARSALPPSAIRHAITVSRSLPHLAKAPLDLALFEPFPLPDPPPPQVEETPAPIAEPASKPRPEEPAAPKPRVDVDLLRGMVSAAQVKLGGRAAIDLGTATRSLSLHVGTHRLLWRTSGADPYRAVTVHLRQGHRYQIYVDAQGPKLVERKVANR